MYGHARSTIRYYRFQDPDLVNDGSFVESCSQPAGKDSSDEQAANGLTKGKEREGNGEAELPGPFEYFEDENSPKVEQGDTPSSHQSAPLPQFFCFENPPKDLTKLEPLDYYLLDPEVYPVRLLAILPYFGNRHSTVQCNIFPLSLQEQHYCYAAVTKTRGNKTLTSNIIINNKVKQVTRNLEVFLRYFRKSQCTQVVWIREICLSQEDLQIHQTPGWRDWIIGKACHTLSMPSS
jgi:hypothetical protein